MVKLSELDNNNMLFVNNTYASEMEVMTKGDFLDEYEEQDLEVRKGGAK